MEHCRIRRMGKLLVSQDKTGTSLLLKLRPQIYAGHAVFLVYISVCVLLALVADRIQRRFMEPRRRVKIDQASSVGAAFDTDGNINARASYSRMRAEEVRSGLGFTGKQALVMELSRLISEGPATPDEIRFLLNAGFEPIVRPDGLFYVPCVENEHLAMDREVALAEEDLAVLEE